MWLLVSFIDVIFQANVFLGAYRGSETKAFLPNVQRIRNSPADMNYKEAIKLIQCWM